MGAMAVSASCGLWPGFLMAVPLVVVQHMILVDLRCLDDLVLSHNVHSYLRGPFMAAVANSGIDEGMCTKQWRA